MDFHKLLMCGEFEKALRVFPEFITVVKRWLHRFENHPEKVLVIFA